MTDKVAIIWEYLRPPQGMQARRVVAMVAGVMGAVRLMRLPYATDLRLASELVYGVLFVGLSIALLVTAYKCRIGWPGRFVAICGVAILSTAGVDALYVSVVSGAILLALSAVLIMEAGAVTHEC